MHTHTHTCMHTHTYTCIIRVPRLHYIEVIFHSLGLINMIPVNCNSTSEGNCVKQVKRGQPVTLCTSHTTTPSTIPKGKHVISVSNSSWVVIYKGVSKPLFTCSRGSCTSLSNSSDVNYTRYSMVTANCLTVSDVQEDEVFVLNVHFYPMTPSVNNVSFNIKYTGELTLSTLNISMCAILLMYFPL